MIITILMRMMVIQITVIMKVILIRIIILLLSIIGVIKKIYIYIYKVKHKYSRQINNALGDGATIKLSQDKQ